MARPCLDSRALLGRKIMPLINRDDPAKRSAGMVQAFLDNVNGDAQLRAPGSEGPAKIVKHPRRLRRGQCVNALFDAGKISDLGAPGPRENEGAFANSRASFQDFYCGESMAPGRGGAFLNSDGSMNGTLPKGGDGRASKGSFAGLQAFAFIPLENDWVHSQRDTPALPPAFTLAALADSMRKIKDHGSLPVIDLLIYQDGTVAEKSLETVRKAATVD